MSDLIPFMSGTTKLKKRVLNYNRIFKEYESIIIKHRRKNKNKSKTKMRMVVANVHNVEGLTYWNETIPVGSTIISCWNEKNILFVSVLVSTQEHAEKQ